jgi:AcrR family transcriptional regulator
MARSAVLKKTKKARLAHVARTEPLTPERIVDAALRIGDANGLDGITTRRLGEALGCAHTAVYLHFPSWDDLLKAVFDRVVERAPQDVVLDGPWEDRAQAICVAIRRTLLDHPVCHPLAQRFPGRGIGIWAEALASVASDAGYSGQDSHFVQRLLYSVGVGMTSSAMLGGVGAASNADFKDARPEERLLLREHKKIDDELVFLTVVDCTIEGLKRGARPKSGLDFANSATASI